MKLYRLIGIMLLLESKKQLTAKTLAERFEVSIRTIYRDIEVLSQAGIPIVTESGPGGGISLMADYQFNLATLDQNEVSSMIKTLVGQELYQYTDEVSSNLSLKVRNTLPIEAQVEYDRLMQSIKIDATTWFGNELVVTDDRQYINIIQESILKKHRLVFDYASYERITLDRLVRPYGLVKKAQAWYLVGYCEVTQEIRIFNLKRIKNLELDGQIFIIPNDFDLNTFWQQALHNFAKTVSIKENNNANIQKAKYPITLKCGVHQRGLLDGFNIIREEQLGELLLITVDLISIQIAMQQLLMDLDSIKIIHPESFKEAVLNKTNKILRTQNS